MSFTETAVYFVKGFYEVMENRRIHKKINEELDEFMRPEDQFISELIYFAVKTEVWIALKKLDYEDLCDGMYLYEIAEDILPNMLWDFFAEQKKNDMFYCWPTDEWIDKAMTKLHNEETKKYEDRKAKRGKS